MRAGAPASGVSFVSGHVVLVTGLAWVITPYLRGRWRVAPWLVVALVSFARVYLARTLRSTSSGEWVSACSSAA